jgi:hypothetical protein
MIHDMKIHTKLSPFTTNMDLPPHRKLTHIHSTYSIPILVHDRFSSRGIGATGGGGRERQAAATPFQSETLRNIDFVDTMI